MIKQAIKIQKGSGKAGKESVGKLSQDQVRAIAQEKLPDLNTVDLEAAMTSVIGTARSMGVEIE